MAKRVFLIHGWDGHPEKGWIPYLKQELEKKDFTVIALKMPDANRPTLKGWIPYLALITRFPTKNDYFVGHSLGCIAILRYLETLRENEEIGGAVLVAGFSHDLNYPGYYNELASFFKRPIKWDKIRSHCKKFIAIHSDNDPYVPLEHGRIFKENLDAELIIERDMKHFSGDDGITELPIALESLLKILQ
ncbi:MAG: alpha/beta hydrolase [bacterium]|nr:alpha/beta hydrolase [bacterium]